MKQPKIGLTLDYQEKYTYSKYPWYALRKNYASSLYQKGGIPFPLVPEKVLVDVYLSNVDGILITGGDFDVPPSFYGQDTKHDTVFENHTRTGFEFLLVKKALERNMPVLGICGGEQLINVALGGSLIQHIPDTYTSDINHEQKNPRHETSHTVHIKEGTLLRDIVKKSNIQVNSAHHQSVDMPGTDLMVNAFAPDKVLEGIESVKHKFCLGVQWHPEFLITPEDEKIIEAFVSACN